MRSWCCALVVCATALGVVRPARAASDDAPAWSDDRDVPPGALRERVFAGADGLKNLVILSIAQDSAGLLWVGTDDGVYRFDGERFTHFSVEDGLPSSLIYVVAAAPDGEICVGAHTGLACWTGTRFALVPALARVEIRTLVSHRGQLWIGTENAGLYVRDAHGHVARAAGWSDKRQVYALRADAQGLVIGSGPRVLLGTGDGAWRDAAADLGLGGEIVSDVLRDRAGDLWIRSGSQLRQLPLGAAQTVDVAGDLPTGRNLIGSPNGMALGPRGEVLVGTEAGVAVREHRRWRVLARPAEARVPIARTLFLDRDATLWIGSAGLVQVRGLDLLEHYDPSNGFPGDIAWRFARDRGGTLWVGTSKCLARMTGGRWQCLPGTDGHVRSFVPSPHGGVYVGSTPAGLRYIDPTGQRRALGPSMTDRAAMVFALALGPEGDLWVGTRGGLFRLHNALPGPLERVEIPGAPTADRFTAMVVVEKQLWITSSAGLFVLDHGAWHRFGPEDGFRSVDMRYLLARADGRLCTAYIEGFGVTCFRYEAGRVHELEQIGPAEGLSSAMVYFLGEDRARRLWVGTGNGVDVVGPSGVGHFDDGDGLVGNDSAANAFLLDLDDSVWLGASGGATHVMAQRYAGPGAPPRARVLGGRLGDRSFVHGQALTTPHDQNALYAELAPGSLLDPTRLAYQVRLSPHETAWSTTHQRQIRYPALPPGSYRLEVRAQRDGGAWGPVDELRFAIEPAWWQRTWWFAALGAAVLAGGFTWRQRRALRQQTRQLHAQSEASFRVLIDHIPDLLTVHRHTKLVFANQASRRFYGLDEAGIELADIALIDRVHPEDRTAVSELLARVREAPAHQVSEIIEIRLRSGDGSWRTCEASGVLVEVGGEPTVVASARDVTERKRLRAQLQVADRMASLGTLAAGIAHEINNPLAYVVGNLEAMDELLHEDRAASARDRRELRASIADARDGADRVRKIVQGLRSFSRSEDEVRRPVALVDVLEASMRMTHNQVRHRAELVRELGPVPAVIADDGRLTQVFINLLINAVQAIPEGHSDVHRITVRTRTDAARRAVVEIEDTGSGIPPELAARVFDPFFTTKSVGEGTGLGLSICHGIISGLGGQIAIEPANRPGHTGTIVRVVLPPAPDAAAVASAEPRIARDAPSAPVAVRDAPSAPLRSAPSVRKPRVLLVDDEAMVAQTIERLLRRDYEVTVALCAQDALEHIAKGAWFDAIISDVMMPTMTGIEMFEELRRVAPLQAQRLIFLSGGAFTAQTRDRLDELGVPQLEKPVTAQELRACVLRMVQDADALAG